MSQMRAAKRNLSVQDKMSLECAYGVGIGSTLIGVAGQFRGCPSSQNNTENGLAWLDREPCCMEDPWVLVATAPPMVWSMNQDWAGRIHPAGCFQ